jgi:hypothetical protein
LEVSLKLAAALLAIALASSACAMSARGDFVSFAVWNGNVDHAVEDVKVIDTATHRPVAAELSLRPLPTGAPGWQAGGVLAMADDQQSVPEHVEVSWRLPPTAGQRDYEGTLVGPFALDLRSRIPPAVLQDIRGSTSSQLAIGIRVGIEPIAVRWTLLRHAGSDITTTMHGGGW